MKIFIVVHSCFRESWNEGCFDSVDAAEKYIDNIYAKEDIDESSVFTIEEHELNIPKEI